MDLIDIAEAKRLAAFITKVLQDRKTEWDGAIASTGLGQNLVEFCAALLDRSDCSSQVIGHAINIRIPGVKLTDQEIASLDAALPTAPVPVLLSNRAVGTRGRRRAPDAIQHHAGRTIRRLRSELGLVPTQLAQRLNWDPQTIRRIESSQELPPQMRLADVVQLGNVLGVGLSAVIGMPSRPISLFDRVRILETDAGEFEQIEERSCHMLVAIDQTVTVQEFRSIRSRLEVRFAKHLQESALSDRKWRRQTTLQLDEIELLKDLQEIRRMRKRPGGNK